jgi:hypothetical protein
VCSGATEYGCNATFAESARPNIWIGYPGETAIIDFESDGTNVAVYINSSGANTWVDNLTLQNIGNHGWRFNIRNSYGIVARRITASDLMDGEDSNNSAFFMWTGAAYPDQSYFDTVQNSTFRDVYGDGSGTDGGCALKLYGIQFGVLETSTYNGSAFEEGIIAPKSGITRTTIRANICGTDSAVRTCIGANMNTDSNSEPLSATGLEIYHNLLKSNASDINDGTITLVQAFINDTFDFSIYRNTLIGQLLFKHYAAMTGSGNYYFYDNVIANTGDTGGSCPLHATCVLAGGSWDYSHWVDNGDNLLSEDDGSIANSTTGALVGSYRTTYLGVAGFELALGTPFRSIGSVRFGGNVRFQ